MGSQTTFDARWKKMAQRGDSGAVQMLIDEIVDPLYRFCFYRVDRNRHVCEDVVQETLILAIRDLSRYEPARADGNIFPWITGLARNEIQRVFARDKNTTSLQSLWEQMDEDLRQIFDRLESDPIGDQVLEREETREMVNITMSQLPPHYRQALEAKYVDCKSVRDIAAARSTTERAVESLLTRSRQAFREAFLALARNLNTEFP